MEVGASTSPKENNLYNEPKAKQGIKPEQNKVVDPLLPYLNCKETVKERIVSFFLKIFEQLQCYFRENSHAVKIKELIL